MKSLNFSNALQALLQAYWVQVTFVKKDGSIRVMTGTTDMTRIPVEKRPPVKEQPPEPIKEEDPLIKLYSEEDGWRSFRASQLTSFTVQIPPVEVT
jgi:hypothetical protein